MIKIGTDVIAFTETEYGVEYVEPLIGPEPLTVSAESKHEAKRLALALDGKVKTRTVYVSGWSDAE